MLEKYSGDIDAPRCTVDSMEAQPTGTDVRAHRASADYLQGALGVDQRVFDRFRWSSVAPSVQGFHWRSGSNRDGVRRQLQSEIKALWIGQVSLRRHPE